MIGKKIPNPKKSSTAAARVGGLVEYMANPETEDAREKCVHYGTRNFSSYTKDAHRLEMIALAECSRSRDPTVHYVLSWPEHERPSPNQADEAVKLLLDEFGTPNHQVIYALHDDTDNRHLHILLNRVDPVTEKCTEIKFDIRALHRALARIEHTQGWQPEQNALYRINSAGELTERPRDPDSPPPITRGDVERTTNEKSAQRQAQERAWPVIRTARSWQALHRGLAEHGMRYEKKGSGAMIHVGETPVKASKVNRGATLNKLEQRLGPYQGRDVAIDVAPAPAPEPLQKPRRAEQWEEYQAGRQAHYQANRESRQARRRQAAEEWEELKERQKRERGSWMYAGLLGQMWRMLRRLEHRQQRRDLRERQDARRVAEKLEHAKYPTWKNWIAQADPEPARPDRAPPAPAQEQEYDGPELVD